MSNVPTSCEHFSQELSDDVDDVFEDGGLEEQGAEGMDRDDGDRIGWVSFNHSNGGQLLCAVGRDGNENMFPISIAVVDIECKSSWLWFLGLLFEDFGFIEEIGWVFMSDKQKVHLLVLNFDC